MICLYKNFLLFLRFQIENKIVIQLDLSSYAAIIYAIQTAVIDQFIALKNRKMNFI